jgi:predicted ATPase
MAKPIDEITIKGFKSIRSLEDFKLCPLNILIGANGAGKSNIVSFFSFLHEMVAGRLALTVRCDCTLDSKLKERETWRTRLG